MDQNHHKHNKNQPGDYKCLTIPWLWFHNSCFAMIFGTAAISSQSADALYQFDILDENCFLTFCTCLYLFFLTTTKKISTICGICILIPSGPEKKGANGQRLGPGLLQVVLWWRRLRFLSLPANPSWLSLPLWGLTGSTEENKAQQQRPFYTTIGHLPSRLWTFRNPCQSLLNSVHSLKLS